MIAGLVCLRATTFNPPTEKILGLWVGPPDRLLSAGEFGLGWQRYPSNPNFAIQVTELCPIVVGGSSETAWALLYFFQRLLPNDTC
jgi:hypothetical protein